MPFIQARSVNPNVPCTPGWCLTYVQDAAGIGTKYGSATAAWNASLYKHRDQNFPPDVWLPLWFSLADNVNGHVVWRQPDGSIWSASHPTSHSPVHHASLAALYSYYSGRLSYLGWTEDVEDTLIMKEENIVVKNSIDSERILNKGLLGRDGLDGRPDAFGPENSAIINSGILNQEMTPDHIIQMWNSSEAGSYRKWIVRVFNERNDSLARVKDLEGQLAAVNAGKPGRLDVQINGDSYVPASK